MNKYTLALLAAFTLVFISCSTSANENKELPEDPTVASLIFPYDKTECHEGAIVSEVISEITFEWSIAENTDSYELVIENLVDNTVIKEQSVSPFLKIPLSRGLSYKWYVTSKSEQSDVTMKSETFTFFNAPPNITTHAPFPADVISPLLGAKFMANSVNLQWVGSDLDNDIISYEVFFDTVNPPIKSLGNTTETQLETDVVVNNTYYWQIKTVDNTNHTSISDVFKFTVK